MIAGCEPSKVSERLENLSFRIVKKAQNGKEQFMNVEKSRKHSGLAIYFYSKDSAFAAVKGGARF